MDQEFLINTKTEEIKAWSDDDFEPVNKGLQAGENSELNSTKTDKKMIREPGIVPVDQIKEFNVIHYDHNLSIDENDSNYRLKEEMLPVQKQEKLLIDKTEEQQEKPEDTEEYQSLLTAVTTDYTGLTKKGKKKAKKDVWDYEKKNKNYDAFGISFDLAHAQPTAADGKEMKKLKAALAEYLKVRKVIFKKYKLGEMSAGDLLSGDQSENIDLLEYVERNKLGDALDQVWARLTKYLDDHNRRLAFGRGRARYRQVLRIRDQLRIDDARFFISKERRKNRVSLDSSYRVVDNTQRDFVDQFVNCLMPTYQRALLWTDRIDLTRAAYRDERRAQRAEGELPGYLERTGQWLMTAFKIKGYQLAAGYNNIGGLVDRTIGTATMLVANTLELAGKVVKLPLKILSCMFNGAMNVFGFKKRWEMDYSLRDNWKSVDDGRKIFRRYLKGACVLPTAVLESLTRGIPALFGHKFKSGVYKRTTKWSKDILNDARVGLKRIGIQGSKYHLYSKQEQEYLDENIPNLNTDQLTRVKKFCLNTLGQVANVNAEKLAFYPVEQLWDLTKKANEDYPDLKKVRKNFAKNLDTVYNEVDECQVDKMMEQTIPDDDGKMKLTEYGRFAMREYALYGIFRNETEELKLRDPESLKDLSPDDMVKLYGAIRYLTGGEEVHEGEDEKDVEENLKEAAITVLTLTTRLPEEGFRELSMKDLETLVRKAFESLDDRETLKGEVSAFLKKAEDVKKPENEKVNDV